MLLRRHAAKERYRWCARYVPARALRSARDAARRSAQSCYAQDARRPRSGSRPICRQRLPLSPLAEKRHRRDAHLRVFASDERPAPLE